MLSGKPVILLQASLQPGCLTVNVLGVQALPFAVKLTVMVAVFATSLSLGLADILIVLPFTDAVNQELLLCTLVIVLQTPRVAILVPAVVSHVANTISVVSIEKSLQPQDVPF
jgi:hypothetical protein